MLPGLHSLLGLRVPISSRNDAAAAEGQRDLGLGKKELTGGGGGRALTPDFTRLVAD